MRTHFNVGRYDHDPSHRSRSTTLSTSVRSGRTKTYQHMLEFVKAIEHTEPIFPFFLICCDFHPQKVLPRACRSSRTTFLFQSFELFIVLMDKAGYLADIDDLWWRHIQTYEVLNCRKLKWKTSIFARTLLEKSCSCNFVNQLGSVVVP